jgi:hypothetical protein
MASVGRHISRIFILIFNPLPLVDHCFIVVYVTVAAPINDIYSSLDISYQLYTMRTSGAPASGAVRSSCVQLSSAP